LVRLGSLAPLVGLTEVRLFNNNLEEMPSFSVSPELEIFEMHNNRVAGAVADEYFTKMPGLKRLCLANNKITSLGSSLCACSALEQLQVQENQLTTLPTGAAWPTSLVTIFLQTNPELTSLPAELGACKALTRVNISGLPLVSQDTANQLKQICTSKKGGAFWDAQGQKTDG